MNKRSKRLLLSTAIVSAAASLCLIIPQFCLQIFSLAFYSAAALLTIVIGILMICTLMNDRSFSTGTRPNSRFEHKAEFLVLCDDSLTVVEDNDFVNTDIRFIKQIKQDDRPCTLDQFIHPDDMDNFRTQIAGCSFLVPTVTNVRMLSGDLSGKTYVDCRCRSIMCPYKNFSRQPAVKLTFTLASREPLSALHSRQLLKSFSSAVWEYEIKTDTLRYTPVSAQNENFVLHGQELISFISDTLVLHPDFRHIFRQLRHTFITGSTDVHSDLKLKDVSGDYRWYTLTGTRIFDENGNVTGYVGRLRNTDNTSSKVNSSFSADIDPLTGLYNRHGMERDINRRLAGEDVNSCALMLIDVDDFASIVQRLGRHFGDALLIDIAALLRSTLLADDVACHITSDTFAIAMLNPGSRQDVMERAQHLSQAMTHIHLNQDRSSMVTCSLGIAFSNSADCTYESLYYQADTALSYAKTKGEGQIETFHDELDYMLSSDSPRKPTVNEQPSALQADDFVSQAIDVLSQARELSSSINIVLSLIGNKYGLRSCEILEFSDDYQGVFSTYRWNQNHNTGTAPVQCSLELIEKTIRLVGDSEYYFCPSVDTLIKTHPDIAAYYHSINVGSFLHIPIRDGLRVSGLICYGGRENIPSFGADVTREIVMISKVMAGYIMLQRTQRSIYRISNIDNLTGCLNMGRFVTETQRLVMENPEQQYVIAYTDIDRFKFINETFGYLVGDRVLIEFTRIVSETLDEDELLGRIDADKFIILLKYKDHDSFVERLSDYDRRFSSVEYLVQGSSYKVPLRCGIAFVSPENEISYTIDMANLARKSVKNIHVSTYVFFDESMKSRILQQKEIEDVMHEALEKGEFAVYLQPKFSLENNGIVGAEALVRWLRPEHGVQRPDDFIPIFENNGFVIELDFYVLEKVCQKLRHDLDNGLSPLPISVNFSRLHLNAKDFSDRIRKILYKYGIAPSLIEVELTESALIGNEDYLVEMMNSLHDIGLAIAMDDFGSGYSTLNLLKKLPVDILKIDKAFFTGNGSDRERLIIANVVKMAKSLDICVVSEGVETAEQADFLRQVNCDIAQGYHYAKPMDIATYENTYQKSNTSI